MTEDQLEEIRGRIASYRDWAKDVYESNIYGIDDRRDLVREVDRLKRIEEAAQAWADLCHDYDLNELGQGLMKTLRAALEAVND